VAIYFAVRDDIRYDPYYPFFLPEHYRASLVLQNKRGYCVWKAAYGQKRVQEWIHLFETKGHFRRNFDTETVVSP
jgi:transglutaminase-like putative cysteine protease